MEIDKGKQRNNSTGPKAVQAQGDLSTLRLGKQAKPTHRSPYTKKFHFDSIDVRDLNFFLKKLNFLSQIHLIYIVF